MFPLNDHYLLLEVLIVTFTLQVLFRVTPVFTALTLCEALVDSELKCASLHQIQAFRSCPRILEEDQREMSSEESSLNHSEIGLKATLVEKNFCSQFLASYL